MQGVNCVPIDYVFDENMIISTDPLRMNECVVEWKKLAYDIKRFTDY
jgi:hypothetical protein